MNNIKEFIQLAENIVNEGEIVQVMEEMKLELYTKISNNGEAIKHINYFDNKKNRMDYLLFKDKGYPIGSGPEGIIFT